MSDEETTELAKDLFRIVHGKGDGGSPREFNCLNPGEQAGWKALAVIGRATKEQAFRDGLAHSISLEIPIPHPRYDALVDSVQCGKTLDGADGVTCEEDYSDKCAKLIKELEKELSQASNALVEMAIAGNAEMIRLGALVAKGREDSELLDWCDRSPLPDFSEVGNDSGWTIRDAIRKDRKDARK